MTPDQPAEAVVIRRPDRPGDLEWIVAAHRAEYDREFGWNESFTELVGQIVASYADHHDADREAGWIAEVGAERVGCVLCVATDDRSTAQLRILLVTDRARGLGVGTRLVDECVGFARAAGYGRMTLWTNDDLVSAVGSTKPPASPCVTSKPTTASATTSSARTGSSTSTNLREHEP